MRPSWQSSSGRLYDRFQSSSPMKPSNHVSWLKRGSQDRTLVACGVSTSTARPGSSRDKSRQLPALSVSRPCRELCSPEFADTRKVSLAFLLEAFVLIITHQSYLPLARGSFACGLLEDLAFSSGKRCMQGCGRDRQSSRGAVGHLQTGELVCSQLA